jgi:hypothetical protein
MKRMNSFFFFFFAWVLGYGKFLYIKKTCYIDYFYFS